MMSSLIYCPIECRAAAEIVAFRRVLARPIRAAPYSDQRDLDLRNAPSVAAFEAEALKKAACWRRGHPAISD
jgi:hypothetical protein